jgi:hypothetical protein
MTALMAVMMAKQQQQNNNMVTNNFSPRATLTNPNCPSFFFFIDMAVA